MLDLNSYMTYRVEETRATYCLSQDVLEGIILESIFAQTPKDASIDLNWEVTSGGMVRELVITVNSQKVTQEKI